MNAAIQLVDLRCHYGDLEAVKGVSLSIREGEIFGLLGPNGAGKTSILSMLATLLPPSGGDALLFGKSLARDVAHVRRLVGLAPQRISLYPDLTGAENLEFFGQLHGARGAELRRRAAQLLERVGLAERADDRVRTYSGGMQRRLNLVCSLVHRPRALLLDEPTAGVDPQSRENHFEAVRELAREGATILYTTHYMEEAERLCDRIAILDEGHVAAAGTLSELLEIVGLGEVIELSTPGGPLDELRFESLPGFAAVEVGPERTRIFVKNAGRALGGLGSLLAGLDREIGAVEVYPVDLGRVFMYLTGKALRD